MYKINNISEIINNSECTGCGICSNTCPNDTILMKEDIDGFIMPVVEDSKCTNCGKCKNVCPAINLSAMNTESESCFAVKADSQIRAKSASGGMFTILAQYVLKNKGYVCGAAFTEDWDVHHIIIDKEEDLDKLRRSKYIQSKTGNIYTQIKSLLENDKLVLFTGTPCQVSALKLFLGKAYKKLITVDLVCHGVPNYKVFRKFLEGISPNISNIKNVNFRDKERYDYSSQFTLEVGKEKIWDKYIYSQGFNNNLYSRISCSECKYACLKRPGDLTIGDFWGIECLIKNPINEDFLGTSIVFLNSKTGFDIFDKIKNEVSFTEIQKDDKLIATLNKYNYPLVKKSGANPGRKRFFELINKNKNFSTAFDYAMYNKYDVGILNVGFSMNYGAILTNYALYKTLQNLNLEPLVIDKPIELRGTRFSDINYTDTIARKFNTKYMDLSPVYKDENESQDLNNICDFFIVGSDQVWCYGCTNPYKYYYFMNWVYDFKKKISYASSFANETYNESPELVNTIKYFLNRFDAVSVREDSGVDICKNKFEVNATQVLDPVFIAPLEIYDELENNSKFNFGENDYVFTYVLDPNEKIREIISYVKKHLNLDSHNFIDGEDKFAKNILKFKNTHENACVEDFVKGIKNSKFVITNSFHGVCFSIIFNKPFICIPNKFRGFARFKSLLKLLKLEDRMIENVEELEEKKYLLDELNYEKINEILNAEKYNSLKWLKTAINTPKKTTATSFDYLIQKSSAEARHTYNEINRINSKLNEQNKLLKYKIFLLFQKNTLIKKYYKYKILKFFTFGTKRKEMIKKLEAIKQLLDDIKFEELNYNNL